MALKDIFKMTKANRYTADGREELIKAQEAVTEDRRYNIGEISEKTGLQKTANGWVKPSKGGAGKAERNYGTITKKHSSKPGVINAGGHGHIGLEEMKEAAEKGLTGQALKDFYESKKPKAESKPAEKKSALKLPDEKSSFSTDVNRMKKLKKEDYKQYTIQLEKLHSKYPINKWKDLLNKTTQDEAPRILTGDTRIRVRK